jgi:hypothetical protein
MLEPTVIAIVLLFAVVTYQHFQIHMLHDDIYEIIEAHNGLVEATSAAVSEIKEEIKVC